MFLAVFSLHESEADDGAALFSGRTSAAGGMPFVVEGADRQPRHRQTYRGVGVDGDNRFRSEATEGDRRRPVFESWSTRALIRRYEP